MDIQDTAFRRLILLKLLGNQPLAIQHCEAYIKHHGLTTEEFVDQYKQNPAEIHRADNIGSHVKSIHTLFEGSLAKLESQNNGALALLRVASSLSPEPIPLDIFRFGPFGSEEVTERVEAWHGLEYFLPGFVRICESETSFKRAIDVLVEEELVKKSGDSTTVVPVLQSYVYHSMSRTERQQLLGTANGMFIRAHLKSVPNTDDTHFEDYARFSAEYQPHADAIAEKLAQERSK